jgi:hypothetical protein
MIFHVVYNWFMISPTEAFLAIFKKWDKDFTGLGIERNALTEHPHIFELCIDICKE